MSVITRNGSTGALPDDTLPRKKTALAAVLNFFRRQPLGTAGLAIMVVMFLAATFANVLTPFDPEENDFQAMMQAPSWTHLLGTDQMGRDIFSRLV